MTNSTYSELREQLLQAARMLFQAGVMSHSGHGNMSVRLPQAEHMLLTATGNIAQLTYEQLAVVTFDGEVVDGTLDPTTREIVAMHSGVYRARADVDSVIHTHSPRVTSFALAHKPLPCVYEAFLRFGTNGGIPLGEMVPAGAPGSVSNFGPQAQLHPSVPA